MSAVYSHRALVGHAGAGESYTVPIGYTFVVRSITAFNANALLNEVGSVVLASASCTLWQFDLGPQASTAIELRVVVNEGETLTVLPGADWDYTVSGYLLSA